MPIYAPKRKGIMRFESGWISACMHCHKQLTVSAVPFSAKITCPGCGAVNIFHNSQHPHRVEEMYQLEVQSVE